jgi:hypothetical protein
VPSFLAPAAADNLQEFAIGAERYGLFVGISDSHNAAKGLPRLIMITGSFSAFQRTRQWAGCFRQLTSSGLCGARSPPRRDTVSELNRRLSSSASTTNPR